ncbi:MAG: hypothetical protein ACK2T6_00620 [Anaerolineae bacterium]
MHREFLPNARSPRFGKGARLAASIALIAALALAAVGSRTDTLAQPGPLGRIAYVRALDNQWDVFSSAPDGSAEEQVTNIEDDDLGFEQDARWSPDGEELAYHTYDGTTVVVWRIPYAGGTPTPVANELTDHYQAGYPSWQPPDGRCLTFAGPREGAASGTDLKQRCEGEEITTLLASDAWNESSSDWRSDGLVLAYEAEPADPDDSSHVYWDIRAVNADGTGERELIGGVGTSERHPRWSPDGERLAYVVFPTSHGRGRGTLRVRDMTTGDDTELVGNVAGPPAWSPDGGLLTFTAIADEGPAPAPGYGPVIPTPAPDGEKKGLYTVDLDSGIVYRLAGGAGGAEATPRSYEWGFGPDWTGGTATPSPTASDTPQPSPTASPTDVATATPSRLIAFVPFAVRAYPPPTETPTPEASPTPDATATPELTPAPPDGTESPGTGTPGPTPSGELPPTYEPPAPTYTDEP